MLELDTLGISIVPKREYGEKREVPLKEVTDLIKERASSCSSIFGLRLPSYESDTLSAKLEALPEVDPNSIGEVLFKLSEAKKASLVKSDETIQKEVYYQMAKDGLLDLTNEEIDLVFLKSKEPKKPKVRKIGGYPINLRVLFDIFLVMIGCIGIVILGINESVMIPIVVGLLTLTSMGIVALGIGSLYKALTN